MKLATKDRSDITVPSQESRSCPTDEAAQRTPKSTVAYVDHALRAQVDKHCNENSYQEKYELAKFLKCASDYDTAYSNDAISRTSAEMTSLVGTRLLCSCYHAFDLNALCL